MILGEHTGMFRLTRDVDASIVDKSCYEYVKPVLIEYCEWLKSIGAIATYEIRQEVKDDRSGGAVYKDAEGHSVVEVDISYCNPVLDSVIMHTERFGALRVSSLAQVVSDKVTVLYSRKQFRRTKDLYDLWMIAENCKVDIPRVRAILAAKGNFPLAEDATPFRADRLKELEHAYDRLVIRNIEGRMVEKPPFGRVISLVSDLCMAINGR